MCVCGVCVCVSCNQFNSLYISLTFSSCLDVMVGRRFLEFYIKRMGRMSRGNGFLKSF